MIRPTTDKVRNAVFSSLFDRVDGAQVLDLFCGTGAYGLEAVSRGAENVVFVDINTDLVKKNVLMLDKSSYSIVKGRAESVIERINTKFDLVFADPPYGEIVPAEFLKAVYDNEILANEGILIYEESSRTEFGYPEELFELKGEKRYGDTKIYYLTVKS